MLRSALFKVIGSRYLGGRLRTSALSARGDASCAPMQHWIELSDLLMEEVLYESDLLRHEEGDAMSRSELSEEHRARCGGICNDT